MRELAAKLSSRLSILALGIDLHLIGHTVHVVSPSSLHQKSTILPEFASIDFTLGSKREANSSSSQSRLLQQSLLEKVLDCLHLNIQGKILLSEQSGKHLLCIVDGHSNLKIGWKLVR